MKSIKLSRKKAIVTVVYVALLGHFLFSNVFFTVGPVVLVHNSPQPACVPNEMTSCDIHCPVLVGSTIKGSPANDSGDNLMLVRAKGFPLAWQWQDSGKTDFCGLPSVQEPSLVMPVNIAYITVLTLLYVFYMKQTLAKKNTRPKGSRTKD